MKNVMFLFKDRDDEEEMEELCRHFSNDELDSILERIRVSSGSISDLFEAFKDELRRRVKKKKK